MKTKKELIDDILNEDIKYVEEQIKECLKRNVFNCHVNFLTDRNFNTIVQMLRDAKYTVIIENPNQLNILLFG